MRAVGDADLAAAIYIGGVGLASLWTALGIWRQRNGGILTRALCVKLAVFGVWAFGTMLAIGYDWHHAMAVSAVSQGASLALDLFLSTTQLAILMFVFPHFGRETRE